jgi:hypothetical protein
VTRQYPAAIRHRAAFEAWYAAGRKISPEVLAAAKVRNRNTVAGWKTAEGWEGFADQLDSKATEVIAEATTDRIALVVDAKEKHIEDMKALLGSARIVASALLSGIVGKLQKGEYVDQGECAEWARSFRTIERAGAGIFSISQPMDVQHSISPATLAAIKTRLTPILELAREEGVTVIDVDARA